MGNSHHLSVSGERVIKMKQIAQLGIVLFLVSSLAVMVHLVTTLEQIEAEIESIKRVLEEEVNEMIIGMGEPL
jgi:hypothetical protein